VGPFYSRAMPIALATAGIEIVGAMPAGLAQKALKSWAHFIAELCLQPWPQHELKSWARFKTGIENRGRILKRGYACSLGPRSELKSWAHFTMGFENRGHIL